MIRCFNRPQWKRPGFRLWVPISLTVVLPLIAGWAFSVAHRMHASGAAGGALSLVASVSTVPASSAGEATECPEFTVARVACKTSHWLTRVMTGLADWSSAGWPLAALFSVAMVAGGLVVFARAMSRLRAAGDAVWLRITPPPTMAAGGAAGLWRVLSGCLRHAPRGWPWAPRPQLSVEWWADPSGLHVGVWVPPKVRPQRVADAITRAWPGAQVQPTHPPMWHRYPARLLELTPAEGPWAPLNPATSTATGTGLGAVDQSEEPLRAVLGALAERAPGEQASVQLIVSHHRDRDRVTSGLAGGLRTVLPALLGTLAGALAHLVVTVLDLITPGTSTPTRGASGGATGRRRDDTSGDPAARAAATKRAHGPHLRVTLRVAVSVPMPHDWRHDRACAVDIATGYELVTNELCLRWRRLWAAEYLTLRTHGHTWIATLGELGALFHLPTDPARYRLAAPGVRRLPTRGATTHLPPPAGPPAVPPAEPLAGQPRRPARRPGHPGVPDRDTPPNGPANTAPASTRPANRPAARASRMAPTHAVPRLPHSGRPAHGGENR